jgi:hypothetical protein
MTIDETGKSIHECPYLSEDFCTSEFRRDDHASCERFLIYMRSLKEFK